MTQIINPPFGTHALPDAQERFREKADEYSDTFWGRTMISRYRKKALKGQSEPFDVEVAPLVKARLYPSGNRCEKRAFAGVQIWDAQERLALNEAVKACKNDKFVFLDVGANVGLYSLFVSSYCRQAGQPSRIIAIEPGVETCARLEANIAASEAPVHVVRSAISDVPGTGNLGGGDTNRGEAKLQEDTSGETVVIDTLIRVAQSQGISYINAMKVDIEGHDFKALKGFFEEAPKGLHPELMIIEVGKEERPILIDLLEENGYTLVTRTGLNAIMVKPHV